MLTTTQNLRASLIAARALQIAHDRHTTFDDGARHLRWLSGEDRSVLRAALMRLRHPAQPNIYSALAERLVAAALRQLIARSPSRRSHALDAEVDADVDVVLADVGGAA